MFALDFKLINQFFFVVFTEESLHSRVSSVFPQEFVSAQFQRMLITVPVSNVCFQGRKENQDQRMFENSS